MAKLHGELTAYKGSRRSECSRLASTEIDSHISTWEVALDCHLNADGSGNCVIRDHHSGRELKSIGISAEELRRYRDIQALERRRY